MSRKGKAFGPGHPFPEERSEASTGREGEGPKAMGRVIQLDADTLDREVWRYKMKDLTEATGLERQAIHFYIQQGLLPPGLKTGRNMAWYGEAHLERLRLIQKLQQERFLPLKAIKAIFEGREKGVRAGAGAQFLQAGQGARLGKTSLTSAPEREGRPRSSRPTSASSGASRFDRGGPRRGGRDHRHDRQHHRARTG